MVFDSANVSMLNDNNNKMENLFFQHPDLASKKLKHIFANGENIS